MNERAQRRLAWSAFLIWILFVVMGTVLSLAARPLHGQGSGLDIPFSIATAAFPIVGILILTRQPANRIGWVLMAIGLGWAAPLSNYGDFAVSRGLPAGLIFVTIGGTMWAPPIGLMGTSLLLRFPDGELLSPRWKRVEWLAAFAITATVLVILFTPGSLVDSGYPKLQNPLGIEALGPLLRFLIVPLIFLLPLTILASAASMVSRFRRSKGMERLQLKWLTSAAAVAAIVYLIAMIASINYVWASNANNPFWVAALQQGAVLAFALIPISIGFAILKHRLYDIDVVINKTVVFGTLAAFITAVYVAIVVGIGALIGSGNKPNLGLSILATAIVAVAFQPVRERVQHFANRLVYGKRATPYEVLAEFSGKVAETYATEDVLPRMARTVAEGTGAAHAEVWLRSGTELRPAGSWPEGGAVDSRSHIALDGQLPDFEGVDHAIAVRHQGELLGALTVTKPAGEPLTPAEEGLLSDLASQAGLVLRNVGLSSELLARLDELKASRQRLVAAQDQERRRLERDLHDGAQQHLVALKTRLALAERLTERDPGKAEQLIATLEQDAGEALETLRDLARGIYPPLLADQGLVAALDAQARKAPVAVEVHGQNIARYPQEIEAAVYFCCLEALQNVGKYAAATKATIALSATDDALEFGVRDDGVGFDPRVTARGSGTQNMADRVAAMGGTLTVESTPGAGTVVGGRLPIRSLESVA
jgi:signal transduction histidine kinase